MLIIIKTRFLKKEKYHNSVNVLYWKDYSISFHWDKNKNISFTPMTLMNYRYNGLAKDTEAKYIFFVILEECQDRSSFLFRLQLWINEWMNKRWMVRSSFVRCFCPVPRNVLKIFSETYNVRNSVTSANLKSPLKSIFIQVVTTIYWELTIS